LTYLTGETQTSDRCTIAGLIGLPLQARVVHQDFRANRLRSRHRGKQTQRQARENRIASRWNGQRLR